MNKITVEAVKNFIFMHATDIGCIAGGLVGAYYAGKSSRKSDYIGQKVPEAVLSVIFGAAAGGVLTTITPYMLVVVPACAAAYKAGESMGKPEKQLR